MLSKGIGWLGVVCLIAASALIKLGRAWLNVAIAGGGGFLFLILQAAAVHGAFCSITHSCIALRRGVFCRGWIDDKGAADFDAASRLKFIRSRPRILPMSPVKKFYDLTG